MLQKDRDICNNLQQIRKNTPELLKKEIEVIVNRDKLCQDMADLIRRLPLNEKQGRILYDAISGRFKNITCYKCLKVKCVLSGKHVYPDGDMSKPKRFVCGDCV